MNGLNGDLSSSDLNNEQKQLDESSENKLNNKSFSNENNLNKENSNKNEEQSTNSVPTACLIVKNLVRPFTLVTLKKVLSKYGKIIDDKFYLTKDKSKCYVVYENEKIAEESRVYINSLKWPASNPSTLESDFFSLNELDLIIKKNEEEKIQEEKERKEQEALEAAKQEERKQQLKEELSKRFNNELLGANLNDSDILNLSHLNNSSKSTNTTVQTQNDDTEQIKEREISPARNAISNVLLITNLTRPFSIPQLKQLLTKYGPIIEEKFWIDKVKSKCYAVYESNDDALKARNSIHGLKWPSKLNTKTLRADFGKLNDVNELINKELNILKAKEDKPLPVVEKSNQEKDKEEENKNEQQEDQNHNAKQIETELKNNEKIEKSITPPRNPVSKIVFIKNLTRPFTIQQLKELLSQDGNYDEERFWIDKIKSKCYAVYENEEIANKTRERLHKLTWPSGNLRKLVADFATETELEYNLNLNKSNKTDKPNKEIDELRDRRLSLNEKPINNEHDDRIIVDHQLNDNLNNSNKRRREKSLTPIKNKREHKDDNYYTDSNYLEKDNSYRNNYDQTQHHQDSPGNILENLFKKTETKPSIYWMPLNDIDVKIRDEQREINRLNRQDKFKRYDLPPPQREFNNNGRNNNGRNRSPRERTPPPYLRHPAPSRNYSPHRQERLPYHANDKRPPFRPPMQHRRSMERNYSFDRRNNRPQMMRSPERPNRERFHELRDRHARSPISPLNRRRTPEKQEDYQNKNKRKISVDKVSSKTGSASSNGSSDSASEYSSPHKRPRHTPTRDQSPRRAVPVDNRTRR